jgi:hypothetical protein
MSCHSAGGFASILAIAALAFGTAATAGIVIASRSIVSKSESAAQRMAAEDLARNAESLACTWLDRHGGSLVFPETGGALVLCNYRWNGVRGTGQRIAIAIHDAGSALPRSALTPGDALRLQLPFSSAPSLLGTPAQLSPAQIVPLLELPNSWTRLPDRIPDDAAPGSLLDPQAIAGGIPAVCHISPDNHGIINLNTAPAWLVRATCNGSGLDAEVVLESRRRGIRIEAGGQNTRLGVRLVSDSPVWYILVIAEIGRHACVRLAVADGAAGSMKIIRRYDAAPSQVPPP